VKMVRLEELIISIVAIGLSFFFLYTAYEGTFYPFVQRAVPLTAAVALVFLTIRFKSGEVSKRAPWYDWVCALITIPVFGYAALYSDYLANRWPMSRMSTPDTIEITFAVIALCLLLEAVRRTIGAALVVVILAMLAYTFFGDKIPWRLMQHTGFSVTDAVDYYYLTIEGIWGSALGIAATYIALFVIFGAFMEKGGATDFFIDLANAIAGEAPGGPAKVAIFASALVGSVTGSTVANVYTTGQLSIPLMKKVGYRASFAGAVEALASNGGQLMPPIMGAAAFILAANAGVPYFYVVAASVFPALLYFMSLFYFIHLEALKRDIKGLPKGTAPQVTAVLLKGGHLMLPIGLLVVLLAKGFSPLPAGFYATLTMVGLSWIRKDTRIGPRLFLEAMKTGATNSLMIIVVCAAVGIVIGTFTLTGLGLSLTSTIISLSGGNFIALLLLVAAAAIILGTGMNTVAAFILISIVAVPALQSHGIDQFSANIFVFYLALLSMITPPVCLAVFAAAAIAGANPWETALEAVRLGVVAYLLPFITLFSPGVLLLGSKGENITDMLSAAVAIFVLVSAIQGWMFGRMRFWIRGVLIVGACALLWPSIEVTIVGIVFCVLGILAALLFQILDKSSKLKMDT
jgi:TRAP transporter 4TM/12TM fusion protein